MGDLLCFWGVSFTLTKVSEERVSMLTPLVARQPREQPKGVPMGWALSPPTQRDQLPFLELPPDKQEPNLHVLVLQLLIMPCTGPQKWSLLQKQDGDDDEREQHQKCQEEGKATPYQC